MKKLKNWVMAVLAASVFTVLIHVEELAGQFGNPPDEQKPYVMWY